MESGYVKFFDAREGKLFGFLVDELGNELFFHYSDGRSVRVWESHFGDVKFVDLVESTTPLRFPKKGDRLAFDRGRNAKGPKARPWCFKREYDNALDEAKRNLTLEEAKEILASSKAKVLEYVKTSLWWGTTTIIVTTEVIWYSVDDKPVGRGEFWVKKERHSEHLPDRVVGDKAGVAVSSPDCTRYHNTYFQLENAIALKDLGIVRQVDSGVYVSVKWNGGGSDQYVVDPATVRNMTNDEWSADPVFSALDQRWLRCSFAKEFGGEQQVVKIIAHLGGHD